MPNILAESVLVQQTSHKRALVNILAIAITVYCTLVIKTTMKDIFRAANLGKIYTNHCKGVTVITELNNTSFDLKKHISTMTVVTDVKPVYTIIMRRLFIFIRKGQKPDRGASMKNRSLKHPMPTAATLSAHDCSEGSTDLGLAVPEIYSGNIILW